MCYVAKQSAFFNKLLQMKIPEYKMVIRQENKISFSLEPLSSDALNLESSGQAVLFQVSADECPIFKMALRQGFLGFEL